jgi:small subunit ribosomal protein S6
MLIVLGGTYQKREARRGSFMSFYECVIIARQDIAVQLVETLAAELAETMTGLGGSIKKTEQWGLRTIAHRIKKNRKGHYFLFNIDAPSKAVTELERQMSLNEDILRFLTIRVDELEEGPSAVLQSRNQRDDRPVKREGYSRDNGGRDGNRGRGRNDGGYNE